MKKYILTLILLIVATAAQAHSWRGHRYHRHHHHHHYGYVAAFHHGYMAYQYHAHPHYFSMMYVARPRPAVRVVYDYGYSEYEDSDFSSSYEEIPCDEAYEQTAPANEANERPNGRTSAPATKPSAPAASTNRPSAYLDSNFSYDPFDSDNKPAKNDPYAEEYLQLVADNENLEEYLAEATDWVNEAYDYFLRLATAYSKTPNLTDVQKRRYKEAREIMPKAGKHVHKKIVHSGRSWKRLSTEEKIAQLKADSKKLHAEEEELNVLVDKYEVLYLKLVNDFFDNPYTKQDFEEAKKRLDRVIFNEAKSNFQALIENYLTWLYEIGSICQDAEEDFKANHRAWSNPYTSHADTFIKKLDNCQYSRRADKDWSVPYFDDLIKLAKARMAKYKNAQTAPLNFDDILPSELPKKEPKTIKKTTKPTSKNSSLETRNGKVTGVYVH